MSNKKRKIISVHIRNKEYENTFHVDDNIFFCNYYNIFIVWKYKSIVDGHCSNQKHKLNIKSHEKK